MLSSYFYTAVTSFQKELKQKRTMCIYVSLLPHLASHGHPIFFPRVPSTRYDSDGISITSMMVDTVEIFIESNHVTRYFFCVFKSAIPWRK